MESIGQAQMRAHVPQGASVASCVCDIQNFERVNYWGTDIFLMEKHIGLPGFGGEDSTLCHGEREYCED